MKFKKIVILLTVLCFSMTILAGCKQTGSDPSSPAAANETSGTNDFLNDTDSNVEDNDSPDPLPEEEAPDAAESASGENETVINADELYEGMALSGTVTDFTADGCIVIPIINESTDDGGIVSYVAVEGAEDKSKNVTVTYNNDCVFQLAVLDVGTGNAALSSSSKDNIKKQTTLLLYGSFEDTYHLNVSKVIIEQIKGDKMA